MTPRPDIVGIEIEATKEQILKIFEDSPHVVYPVYRKNLDDIIGTVSIKNLIVEISKDNFDLKENIREVCFLNEFVKVYDALETMRKKKTKYGVISGEFGITLGIITMNDVMDALLGNMPEKARNPILLNAPTALCSLTGNARSTISY